MSNPNFKCAVAEAMMANKGGSGGGELFITFNGTKENPNAPGYLVVAASENLYSEIQKMFETHIFRPITMYKIDDANNFVDIYHLTQIEVYDDYYAVNFGSYVSLVGYDGAISAEYND